MDRPETLRILQLLADGVDPHSGEVFENSSPYQHPQVVRALFHALKVLEKTATAPEAPTSKTTPEKPAPPELNLSELSGEEQERFEKLRAWRTEQARKQNTPQYTVAHNRQLFEMAQLKDLSFASLSGIKGFGGKRAEKYAEEIQRLLEE